MYITNFEYDGTVLSDFGFIVCEFNRQSGANVTQKGSEVSFITYPVNAGKRFIVGGTKYEDCLEATIQICKDPEIFTEEEMVISPEEFRQLSRWLNRREFLWFHGYDTCGCAPATAWFRASFRLSKIQFAGDTVGISLDITTDSPFGYGEEVRQTVSFTDGELTKNIRDQNDEIGEITPYMEVTCNGTGALSLANEMTGRTFSVENCSSGEVITQSGDTMIIETSDDAHDIANDFNYEFFRLGNTYSDRDNMVTASMPCTVVLSYRPIYKDTL